MAIVQLREVMGIKAVAEFVEDQDIFEELIKIGIDYAQGYHVGGLLGGRPIISLYLHKSQKLRLPIIGI